MSRGYFDSAFGTRYASAAPDSSVTKAVHSVDPHASVATAEMTIGVSPPMTLANQLP
jgi:hypothetical protein